MKKYTIFYKEGDRNYPVYIQNDKYWLGGSRADWLLCMTKAEAQRHAKKASKQKSPFFEKGTIFVSSCKLEIR